MTKQQIEKLIHDYLRKNLSILVETDWEENDPGTKIYLSVAGELIASASLPKDNSEHAILHDLPGG